MTGGAKRLVGHQRPVRFVAFSARGDLLASGDSESSIAVWDLKTGQRTWLVGGSSELTLLRFASSSLLSASADNTLRSWSPATGTSRILSGHAGPVYAVDEDRDGTLYSGSGDGSIAIWDQSLVATGRLIGHAARVQRVVTSGTGDLVASASLDGTVRLWRPPRRATMLASHSSAVFTMSVSADERLLATAGRDQAIRIWNTNDGSAAGALGGHTALVNHVAFAPRGSLLASSSWDQSLALWNVALRRRVAKHDLGSVVRAMVFSPDGGMLAVGAQDGTVAIVDVVAGTARRLGRHEGRVVGVAFHPRSGSVISSGKDGALREWSISSDHMALLARTSRPVSASAYSRSGRLAALATDEGATVFDLEKGTSTVFPRSATVYQVAFSDDERWLAIASNQRTLEIVDVAAGRSALREGHEEKIIEVAFAPDSQRLATVSTDGTCRIWDLSSLRTWIQRTMSPVNTVRFSPSRKLLFAGFEDGRVRGWSLEQTLEELPLQPELVGTWLISLIN